MKVTKLNAVAEPFEGSWVCRENCELGEGIAYDPMTDTVWWFDIKGKRLHQLHVESGTKQSHPTPFLGSAIARIDAARQLVVADSGLMVRNAVNGTYTLFRVLEDNKLTRSNDSRVHQSGAMWTSRMGRNAEPGLGAIYHVDAERTTLLFSNLTIPNGICFSPDGEIAYFADSRRNEFMKVRIDPLSGLPAGEPLVLADETRFPGCIDGAVCDADGLIWSARWGDWSIDVHTPEGNKVRRYRVPAPQVSCPAFVGRQSDRLFVTTAWEDMDANMRLAHPESGRTFELGRPVKGRLEPAFIL